MKLSKVLARGLEVIARDVLAWPLWLAARLMPRRRKQWVFGAWFGERYADNSRFLFEHVRRQRADVQAIWIARSDTVVSQVRAAGGEAARADSFAGYWACCRAGLAVVSSGPSDVNGVAIAGAKRLQLWHGTPLKKIKFDDDLQEHQPRGMLARLPGRLRRGLFPFRDERYDALIAPSDELRQRMASAFRMPADAVHVTGWPRLDAVLAPTPAPVRPIETARARYTVRRVVTYAPTFRMATADRSPLEGLDGGQLQAVLERHEAIFLVKLHFVQRALGMPPEIARGAPRAILLDDAELPDINLLLPHTDLLLTDYSSVYCDFLPLDRPIIFTPFDLERYVVSERGLYEPYEQATPGPKCRSWSETVEAIDRVLSGQDDWASERARVRQRYCMFSDAENCARVLQVAERLVGIAG